MNANDSEKTYGPGMSELLEKVKRIEVLTLMSVKTMLTVEDLCLLTGWKKASVYKMTSDGVIPYYKPQGKTIFFDKKEIDAWMHNGRVASENEVLSAAEARDRILKM